MRNFWYLSDGPPACPTCVGVDDASPRHILKRSALLLSFAADTTGPLSDPDWRIKMVGLEVNAPERLTAGEAKLMQEMSDIAHSPNFY